jgi:spermidine/putrescine transport system ATP-binding protein
MSEGFAVELREVVKQFGSVTAVNHVTLQIQNGEFFSLLGPSGCGKTTSLRLIAGFETPTSGQVIIDGEVQGHLPAFQRPVNTVFQSYALFPHMTVHQNVSFGLEMKKVPKTEIGRRVGEVLELVHLKGMDKRHPKQLSGGQQQRVALARALVNKPEVLLLDEPLGALDLKLRKAMQLELKNLQEQVGITFIYVTHDQEEALTMSDRIAVMNQGNVLQVGVPADIYEQPTSRFVADFIGETNFIEGTVEKQAEHVEFAIAPNSLMLATWGSQPIPNKTKAILSIRPEKIDLHPLGKPLPEGSRKIAEMPGKISDLVYLGTDTRYAVQVAGQTKLVVRMQNTTSSEHFFKVGDEVTLRWNPAHARVMKE